MWTLCDHFRVPLHMQGVSGLMQRIMDTWKLLDKNEDGH